MKNDKVLFDLTCFIHNYNRSAFLKECLLSIIKQQTRYRIQIIIIDDCSSDKPEEICRMIANKHPNIPVIFLKTSENQGSGKLAAIALKYQIGVHFKSKYFMRIDSDDYINDERKFQKQIDLLENNKDCVACCHPYQIQNEVDKEITFSPDLERGKFSLSQLILMLGRKHLYAHTSTFIYRNIHGAYLPPEFENNSVYGDVVFNWSMLKHGSVIYCDGFMTTYRLHDFGMWTSKSKIIKIKEELKAEIMLLKILPFNIAILYMFVKIRNYVNHIKSKW